MLESKSTPYSYSLSEYTTLVHDNRILEDELRWLRESTRTALAESWKEVENLHCQLSRERTHHVKIETQLKLELKRSSKKMEVWRVSCLAAEESARLPSEHNITLRSMKCNLVTQSICSQPNANHQKTNESSRLAVDANTPQDIEKVIRSYSTTDLSYSGKIWPWSNRNLQDTDKVCTGEAAQVQKPRKQRKIPHSSKATTFIQETCSLLGGNNPGTPKVHYQAQAANGQQRLKQSKSLLSLLSLSASGTTKNTSDYSIYPLEDLSLSISSREKIIISLEQTLDQHLKQMQNMQLEMECSIETHRIKEKKLAGMYKMKEEHLKRVIGLLQKV